MRSDVSSNGLHGASWFVDEESYLHQASPNGWRNQASASLLETTDQATAGDIVVLREDAKDKESRRRYSECSAFEVQAVDDRFVRALDFIGGRTLRFQLASCQFYKSPQAVEQVSFHREASLHSYEGVVSSVLGLTYLGGSNSTLTKGEIYQLCVTEQYIYIVNENSELQMNREMLSAVEVAGQGAITQGGGWIGGGFGLEGMAAGFAIAAILNTVTSKSSMDTQLYLDSPDGEYFFHCAMLEPLPLRIELSPLIHGIRHRNHQ